MENSLQRGMTTKSISWRRITGSIPHIPLKWCYITILINICKIFSPCQVIKLIIFMVFVLLVFFSFLHRILSILAKYTKTATQKQCENKTGFQKLSSLKRWLEQLRFISLSCRRTSRNLWSQLMKWM